ncbi:putative benzoate 4-monooxygenase cytochrome P450 [Viridothelium virens]|uniref:Putative benzoate 4-monooxygenase cytochrome P450 n=1 Tax=Viridothelium virens TaxID=1048519 RepID=A0A6A6GS43_VIRVR|nr:putative benzoate 4-monooxygenase cytochrome P450 [Viridothelium virens]
MWVDIYDRYDARVGPFSRVASAFPDAFSTLRGVAYKDTRNLHERYGSAVRISPNALSFSTAQAWRDIYALKADRTELAKDPGYYKKGEAANIVCTYHSADQTDHARIRKLFAHAFSDSALLEQEPLLTNYFDLLVTKLKQQINGPKRGVVDMMAYYNFTTFDIIGDLTLGEPFGALESGEYHAWIRNVFESIKFLGVLRLAANYPAVGMLLKLLTIFKPSLGAKRAAHMEFTRLKIEKRLERESNRKDFLTYVLRHNDERGMTRPEIMGTCRVLLVAGSETTGTLLSGATYYLLQNPASLHRLQSEVRAAFQTQDEITLRSVSIPGKLPYLEAVLQESFRCCPPIPATLPRVTGPRGAMIDGRFVPANVSVGVHQWSTYHSHANFAYPDTFDPKRWLSDPPIKYSGDDKAALQPFSLGPRGCIGKSLAYFEIRSILARIIWNFDMEIQDASSDWKEQREYAMWDKPSLWVRLKHRNDA